MRSGVRLLVLPALLLLLGAGASRGKAQEAPPTLEEVEAAADGGRLAEARALLERWRASRGDVEDGARASRARLLAARLATDPDSARALYASLAVDGGSEEAVAARLRLAQLRMAEGRPERALEDLGLLRADHPAHPLGPESWLWTGHARHLAGDAAGACEAYRTSARQAAGPDVRARAEEALDRCRGAAAGSEGPPGPAWSVQLGAFRDPDAARSLARQADAVGYSTRVLGPADDGLRRVRAGRWGSRADAEAAARRLAESGFRVLVVEDDDPEGEAGDPDR